MKKLSFVLPLIIMVAAGCNVKPSTTSNTITSSAQTPQSAPAPIAATKNIVPNNCSLNTQGNYEANEATYNSCLDAFAHSVNKVEDCSNAYNPPSKSDTYTEEFDGCLDNVAMNTRDPTVCTNFVAIPDAKTQASQAAVDSMQLGGGDYVGIYTCKASAIGATGQLDKCSSVQLPPSDTYIGGQSIWDDIKATCMTQVAITDGSTEPCNNEAQPFQANCIAAVQSKKK